MGASSTQPIRNLNGGESGTITLPKDDLRDDGHVDEDTDEVVPRATRVKKESENVYTVEILDD